MRAFSLDSDLMLKMDATEASVTMCFGLVPASLSDGLRLMEGVGGSLSLLY